MLVLGDTLLSVSLVKKVFIKQTEPLSSGLSDTVKRISIRRKFICGDAVKDHDAGAHTLLSLFISTLLQPAFP